MLESIVADQTFWIVCAAFLVADNVQRLEVRYLILTERTPGLWIPVFPLYRYRIGRLPLVILNPFFPWQAAIQMNLVSADPRALKHSKRLLSVYRRGLRSFQAISMLLFTIFFAAGPITTHFLGLASALMLFFPLYAAAIIVLTVKLIVERRFWRMTRLDVFSLVFQCTVCPGIFINICRRMSLSHIHLPGDAALFAFACGEPTLVEWVESGLARHIEDLLENDDLTRDTASLLEAYRQRLTR
jgi:hypothetical protein